MRFINARVITGNVVYLDGRQNGTIEIESVHLFIILGLEYHD